ncbi:guanitoxin biosynthesis MATE family efflux transporter GntT [Altericista sp. CCNU0014]|uniref:guanitoxin biosynthesis MATE family efflux transporter GntT n=1 Tax=Altericista sp. CCNU0014 TaxID=3082949 RepID=UPI00384E2F85
MNLLKSSDDRLRGTNRAIEAKMGILHQFFRLAIANILANLMVPLAGLMDVAFLGHLAEIRHLAGVALATVLFNYLYWTFGFLRMGTTGMTAQAMGREDVDAALLVGLRNGAIALGLGTALVLLQYPLRIAGFALFSATPEVKAAGQAYYDALIWGAPATLLNFVVLGWFLGRSQSKKVLLLSAVSNLTNVGLDYLFIVRWGWESRGAGAATALGQGAMLLVGLGMVSRDVGAGQLQRVAKHLLDPTALRATVMLNGELMVRTFALISTFAAFTNLSSNLGTEILSTNAVLLQVVTLAAYFIDGFAFAIESLAGMLSAQKEFAQLARLLRVATATSFGLGLLVSLAFTLAPTALFQHLTNHREILDRIGDYTPWLLPVLGFGSIAYLLDGYFLGLTAGRLLRRSVTIAALGGFMPMAIAAWQLRDAHLLWLGLTLFMALRAIALGLEIPKTLRKLPP